MIHLKIIIDAITESLDIMSYHWWHTKAQFNIKSTIGNWQKIFSIISTGTWAKSLSHWLKCCESSSSSSESLKSPPTRPNVDFADACSLVCFTDLDESDNFLQDAVFFWLDSLELELHVLSPLLSNSWLLDSVLVEDWEQLELSSTSESLLSFLPRTTFIITQQSSSLIEFSSSLSTVIVSGTRFCLLADLPFKWFCAFEFDLRTRVLLVFRGDGQEEVDELDVGGLKLEDVEDAMKPKTRVRSKCVCFLSESELFFSGEHAQVTCPETAHLQVVLPRLRWPDKICWFSVHE